MGVLFPYEERMKARKAMDKVAELTVGLEDHLAGTRKLTQGALDAIYQLSNTHDPEGMRKALSALGSGLFSDYRIRLKQVAPDDLTAFAEVMNHDQPPALHHKFICEHLMEAEAGHLQRATLSAPPGHAKPLSVMQEVIARRQEIFEKKEKLKSGKVGVYANRVNTRKRMKLGEVQVGDEVWTHMKRWRKVTAVHDQGRMKVSRVYDNGGNCYLPEGTHPFLTGRGWVNAADLVVGDILWRTSPGKPLDVNSLHDFGPQGEVYNFNIVTKIELDVATHPCVCLTVEEDSTFTLAGSPGGRDTPEYGGVIVHNSTYASHLFGAWYLGRNQKKIILQAGNTQSFVEDQISTKVRAYIEHDEYQDVFPGVSVSKRKSALKQWKLNNEKGEYNARGVGTKIAGFRANFANVDDPLGSREEAESPTTREKLWAWYLDDFQTRLLPTAPLIVVATRWHEEDLIGKIYDQEKNNRNSVWEFINLPALAKENDPLGRAEGEALWPDFFTKEMLLEIKRTQTGRGWNSLYMGSPIDAEGGVFNIANMVRYTTLPPLVKVKKVTVSVDTANKANERADYTAITVWYETDEGKHYLVNVVRRRLEFTDMKNLVHLIARRYKANEIIVEDKGSGTQYIQTQSGKDGRRRLAPCPVRAINPSNNSKEFRFDGVVPMIMAGEVLFPVHADWIADLEHELSGFPDGAHDDQVDSISQYLAGTMGKTKRGTTKASRKKRDRSAVKTVAERPTTNYIGKAPPSEMIGHNGGPDIDEDEEEYEDSY